MKRAVGIVCLAVSLNAAAADSHACGLVADLAREIAVDRDHGVSYKAELGRLIVAYDGQSDGVLRLAKNIVHVVYIDMPSLSPQGAYNFGYAACMQAK
ncbi:MAG: hypothetical protein P4L91_07630 [Burkholderiaceae bacterium]|nr:hypothetical protein [Burkholderiaceae bacterium]